MAQRGPLNDNNSQSTTNSRRWSKIVRCIADRDNDNDKRTLIVRYHIGYLSNEEYVSNGGMLRAHNVAEADRGAMTLLHVLVYPLVL